MSDRGNLIVFTGSGPDQSDMDLADEMCEAIKQAIYTYAGRVPLATAIGALEIAKREIMDDAE